MTIHVAFEPIPSYRLQPVSVNVSVYVPAEAEIWLAEVIFKLHWVEFSSNVIVFTADPFTRTVRCPVRVPGVALFGATLKLSPTEVPEFGVAVVGDAVSQEESDVT